FPRAMLIMAAAFGLWRARLISNALFAAGVAAVVVVLLGGTTWLSGGFWAPDGVYSRFVSPAIGLLWGMVVSGVLLTRSPAAPAGWRGRRWSAIKLLSGAGDVCRGTFADSACGRFTPFGRDHREGLQLCSWRGVPFR